MCSRILLVFLLSPFALPCLRPALTLLSAFSVCLSAGDNHYTLSIYFTNVLLAVQTNVRNASRGHRRVVSEEHLCCLSGPTAVKERSEDTKKTITYAQATTSTIKGKVKDAQGKKEVVRPRIFVEEGSGRILPAAVAIRYIFRHRHDTKEDPKGKRSHDCLQRNS